MKIVFLVTGIWRGKRLWDSPFGITTQLWINFILRAVSNLLAVVGIVMIPYLTVDIDTQCKP
jgi:hypothetical protein